MSKKKETRASGKELPDVESDTLDEQMERMILRRETEWLCNLVNEDPYRLMNELESPFPPLTKQPAESQSEVPTQQGGIAGDETHADQRSKFDKAGGDEEFRKMMDRVIEFEEQAIVLVPGDYRKVKELGRGGQGIVYLVEGVDDFAALCALKVFFPDSYKSLAAFVADMKRMVRIASRFQRKPHDDVVNINWFGQRDDVYMMQMQYVDGLDLRRLLQPELLPKLEQSVGNQRWADINKVVYSVNGSRQLALKPAIAVYITERVLRGLEATHRSGMVHGDIKPSNIMLDASASVQIIDVGSVFESHSPPSQHHITPAYVAPEYLESGLMTAQSDLASVGYMLIEMLSGKPITDMLPDTDVSTRSIGASDKQQFLEAKRSLPDRLLNILPKHALESKRLVELCRCLIHPDLGNRFASAEDAIVDARGTFEFHRDLMQANLVVCSYSVIRRWLADVIAAIENAGMQST